MKDPSLGAIFEMLKTLDKRVLELNKRVEVLENISTRKVVEEEKRNENCRNNKK